MDLSRQQVINILRRAGLADLADEAGRTFPDPVDSDVVTQFCVAHGLSRQSLMNLMGGSP